LSFRANGTRAESKVKKKPGLTKDSFDALLNWLHPDREMAGVKYEEIRQTLIKIFVRRGCSPAEEMADETINRVIGKLDEIKGTYTGDPALYFYGVAQNLFREYLRKPPAQPYVFKQQEPEEAETDDECLDECMDKLPPESRWFIIEYFQEDKREKIIHRKDLAERLGITHHSLRMRAYRIKAILKSCILECRKRKEDG
jgi:RNA polymerase sigma factor (sigma-70 family)